jgi:GT2 family glycosyltransferase
VSGTSLHVEGAIDPRRFAGEFPAEPPRHAGWRACALGCNLAVRREVFDELGGFDLHVEGADDIDLCWRAMSLGVDLCFEPEARCLKARRTGSSRVWRQHYHYGRADYRLRRRFRAEGCPQPSRVVVRSAGWLVLHLADVLRAERRRTWLVVAARTSGMVVQSLGDLRSASADIADTGR